MASNNLSLPVEQGKCSKKYNLIYGRARLFKKDVSPGVQRLVGAHFMLSALHRGATVYIII